MRILRLNSIVTFRGGAEAYIENITEMLSELGHETLTITFISGEGGHETPENIEVRMKSDPVSRFIKDTVPWDSIVNLLMDKYMDFKPDLIHLHHIRNGFSSVKKFLMKTNVPVIFTAHDALLVCPISTLVQPGGKICEGGTKIRCAFTGCKVHGHMTYELLLASAIRNISNNKIRAILCPSYSIYNYLHANGFKPVVHLPSFSKFDVKSLNSIPDYETILKQTNIGYIGRLENYKGVHDLLEAFAMFLKKHPQFRLKIAGTGGYEQYLKEMSVKLGVQEHIDWLGKIGPEERDNFYGSVSTIVVPSNYWENFPLVAQEALLRGIPSIGANIGGIPEIIRDGETGRIVPISSPMKIAEALDNVYSQKQKTIEMAIAGRNLILNSISPEKHLEGLLKVYNRILSNEDIPDLSEAMEQ